MFLESIRLNNFKNYSNLEIKFEKAFNCFVGENGIGKTNLLDAIYYLCLCRSYFTTTEKQNVRHNEEVFFIQGNFLKTEKKYDVICAYQSGGKKKVKVKGAEYERLSDHIGKFPIVMITPGDLVLITAYGDERRKFIDSIIGQFDQEYLKHLVTYNKVIQQRNALLKQFYETRQFNETLLESFNVQLYDAGDFLHKRRKEFIKEFEPILQSFYELISEGKESVSIAYDSTNHESSMEALLKENIHKDRAAQRTTVGPHKDDFELLIDGHSVKKYGSQGQQKSFIFALKLAQYKMIDDNHEVKPTLLLDDIFDRLDEQRILNLINLFKEDFGQVFITDTHPERVQHVFDSLSIDFELFRMNELKK